MTNQAQEQTQEQVQIEPAEQAGQLLSHVAAYVGHRTIEMGMQHRLFEEIAQHPEGISAEELAARTNMDPLYIDVWARSAFGSHVLELTEDNNYTLAPHMDKFLLDEDFPGYVGALFKVMLQPEFFDVFSQNLPSGKRIWWDECSPDFIQSVSNTGRSFYTRLIPGALSKVPGLSEKLDEGVRILELCCGAGRGLIRKANHYPNCSFVGLDGDEHSVNLTRERLKEEGLDDKISLVLSSLEGINMTEEFDVVTINISMHECRDIEKVAANVYKALKPGGHFVISDFPFPESVRDCRTVPARIMSGIQFFEALIDDQLLPTKAFVDLLNRHNFKNVEAFDVTPVHAITHGRK